MSGCYHGEAESLSALSPTREREGGAMDALKHKVHTAYKVREPNPRSLHPNKPSSPPPPAPPSIFATVAVARQLVERVNY